MHPENAPPLGERRTKRPSLPYTHNHLLHGRATSITAAGRWGGGPTQSPPDGNEQSYSFHTIWSLTKRFDHGHCHGHNTHTHTTHRVHAHYTHTTHTEGYKHTTTQKESPSKNTLVDPCTIKKDLILTNQTLHPYWLVAVRQAHTHTPLGDGHSNMQRVRASERGVRLTLLL